MVKKALIVGSGWSVGPDLAVASLARYTSAPGLQTFAVNESYRLLNRVDVWCTLHPEKLEGWREDARIRGLDLSQTLFFVPELDADDIAVIMKGKGYANDWIPHWWRWNGHGSDSSGSSGLFAVGVAFSLGCEKVLLAGVPMDKQRHWNGTEPWADRDRFAAAWSAVKHRLEGRVRSLSGWTRELLGGPDEQWWSH